MKIFDAMSDTAAKLFGVTFCLAVEREVFRKTLIERDIMTASEIKQFHTAIKNHSPVQIMRRWLNEIAASIEEYDKRNANIDTLNNILERIEFVNTILEGEQ